MGAYPLPKSPTQCQEGPSNIENDAILRGPCSSFSKTLARQDEVSEQGDNVELNSPHDSAFEKEEPEPSHCQQSGFQMALYLPGQPGMTSLNGSQC